MNQQNRSTEFNAIIERLKSRRNTKPLISGTNNSNNDTNKNFKRTEFFKSASLIGNKINNTSSKLEKLAQLAKRKSLFDDKSNEINELTYSIKQEIAQINHEVTQLQTTLPSSNRNNRSDYKKQVFDHQNNMVGSLQSRLANASMGFKELLELRTRNLNSNKERKNNFSYNKTSTSILSHRSSASTSNNYNNTSGSLEGEEQEYLSLDLGNEENQSLINNQDAFIQDRNTAITSIEKTISELGSVFQQLATMVSEQRDVVQRIDSNIEEVDVNVTGAQKQLLKYYNNISSNRWLMIKAFALIMLLFFLFVAFR